MDVSVCVYVCVCVRLCLSVCLSVVTEVSPEQVPKCTEAANGAGTVRGCDWSKQVVRHLCYCHIHETPLLRLYKARLVEAGRPGDGRGLRMRHLCYDHTGTEASRSVL